MNYLIFLSGGKGTRLDANLPKQYLKIKQKYIFEYSLDNVLKSKIYDKIIIVAEEIYKELFIEYFSSLNNSIDVTYCVPGKERYLSVFNALNTIKEINNNDIISIHDSVRIFASSELFKKTIELAIQYDSCIPAKPAINSLYNLDTKTYLNRNEIREIETPQTFNLTIYKECFLKAISNNLVNIYDDGYIYQKYSNKKLYIYTNIEYNSKITTKNDIIMAEWILKNEN